MNRDEKQQMVTSLGQQLIEAGNAFVLEFKGVTVPQVTELRRQLRESGSKYIVVKNTLALIAVKDSAMTELKQFFVGPTAVAYNQKDPVALAKTLTKFAKDVPAISFKGALLNGKAVPATEIDMIASLPTRDQLVSKLLYLLQSPMRGLATVLQANIRNLAVVVDQIAKQRSENAPAPESSASPESSAKPEASASAEVPVSAEASATPEVPVSEEASATPESSEPQS